jgi:hypothetical protein
MRLRRGTIPPKLGKRTRRAVIRLRHNVARERFIRWGFQTNNLPADYRVPPWRDPLWHLWHALGRP